MFSNNYRHIKLLLLRNKTRMCERILRDILMQYLFHIRINYYLHNYVFVNPERLQTPLQI